MSEVGICSGDLLSRRGSNCLHNRSLKRAANTCTIKCRRCVSACEWSARRTVYAVPVPCNTHLECLWIWSRREGMDFRAFGEKPGATLLLCFKPGAARRPFRKTPSALPKCSSLFSGSATCFVAFPQRWRSGWDWGDHPWRRNLTPTPLFPHTVYYTPCSWCTCPWSTNDVQRVLLQAGNPSVRPFYYDG